MTSASDPRVEFVARRHREVGIDGTGIPSPVAPLDVPLRSRLATDDLAAASVTTLCLAAGRVPGDLDGGRIAVAYRSDRHLRIDGVPPTVWSPFSGFWRTADGWVRTHGNYPHHAAGLRRALGLPLGAESDEVAAALSRLRTDDASSAITASGGLAVAVQPERPEADAALRQHPLLDVRWSPAPRTRHPLTHDAARPLAGIRVLDLTRVIAGPVCTRTLAALGAEVLRIDPPHLPEHAWQHLDTGHGKRSAILDARSPLLHELVSDADVVVLGYRASALDRLGLSPAELTRRHPGIVVAQLTAWGEDHPDSAGFDSLVQAASGIAIIESLDGDQPGALPAQALDHSAGYLLAAAVIRLLERRDAEGGTGIVRTSLRRIAAELLGMPRRDNPAAARKLDAEPHLQQFEVAGTVVTTARSVVPDTVLAAPRPWGADQPVWPTAR